MATATKKKVTNRSTDRHKSGFLVRLPEDYREKLEGLKVRYGLKYTRIVAWAIDEILNRSKKKKMPGSTRV